MASSSRPVKGMKRESTEEPNWLELPAELTAKILLKLGIIEILTSARLVCPLWWKICKDPLMWRTIDLTNCLWWDSNYPHNELVNCCLKAIERSCGHLEDISIKYFGNNQILKCIAYSTSHLRRMRLLRCTAVSDKGLMKVVRMLPLLEEFEISFNSLSKNTLELIGQCCPLLKVFKFNIQEKKTLKCDDEAYAIAKTMPELRHLQLLGNRLTNDGLLAILDGCPYIESLDLRACSNVDLSGSLGGRLCDQIRDIYFPEDISDEVLTYVDD
ncbi:putative F-box/LRR-repeat protein 23 [Lotus japonicus]|uniref:putative F-box/LRR-repeat protein 23 n=1 Tax=Lotus japonicus TaxID=34305 RepID=UPI00258A4171|nr:putative F-box/LRR-repeat protein 23 [Lotus japonicus]